jgi:diguanylate cyclase (GGDEF)-like protein
VQAAAQPPAAREDGGFWSDGLSRPVASAVSVALLACVTTADYLTGPDVSFTLLYLGPIAFSIWFAGPTCSLLLALVATLAEIVCNAPSRSHLPGAIQAWNLSVQFGVFLSLAFLLGALKARLEGEQQLARTDPLTGLANRRAFLEAASAELERARRSRQPMTVAYLDCDDFKRVNDLLGHAEGDQLLATVAVTLRRETRTIDALARLGGDEFGVLLADTDGPTAEAALHRLRVALVIAMRDHGWKVGFSIGAVTFVVPPTSVDEMIGRADQLMYETKRRGKNGLNHEILQPRPLAVRMEARA